MSFPQLIATIPVAGTNYTTFTTAKSMLTSSTATEASAGFISLPANFFQRGGGLRITCFGGMSGTSGNTITFQIMVGAVIAFTSGALKVTTTTNVALPLISEFFLTCRSQGNGTLATLIGTSRHTGIGIVPPGGTPAANYAAPSYIATGPETAPAAGTGFDSTVANSLDLFVAMGTSAAGNAYQLQTYWVELIGNGSV